MIHIPDNQKGLSRERIDHTLREIHKRMVDLFHINFTYFSDIRIVGRSEVLDWLTRQMETNLQERNAADNAAEWEPLYRFLLERQVNDHFMRLAYYDREKDTLCISEDLLKDDPQMVIPVSVHELSEKMLSTILPPILEKRSNTIAKMCIRIKRADNIEEVRELFDEYLNLVYMTVFKEGCCEAISLHTLRSMDLDEIEVDALERELLKQYSKCFGLLLDLEKTRRSIEDAVTTTTDLDTTDHAARIIEEMKLVIKTLRNSHMIKGVSYYLGYPLAKAFIERYGLEEVKTALEHCPPFKTEHLSHPHTYLQLLQSRGLLPVTTLRTQACDHPFRRR